MVVALAQVADDLISNRSRSPTTPKPWASSTYSRASFALARPRPR
jgi:hypothetical protein